MTTSTDITVGSKVILNPHNFNGPEGRMKELEEAGFPITSVFTVVAYGDRVTIKNDSGKETSVAVDRVQAASTSSLRL